MCRFYHHFDGSKYSRLALYHALSTLLVAPGDLKYCDLICSHSTDSLKTNCPKGLPWCRLGCRPIDYRDSIVVVIMQKIGIVQVQVAHGEVTRVNFRRTDKWDRLKVQPCQHHPIVIGGKSISQVLEKRFARER